MVNTANFSRLSYSSTILAYLVEGQPRNISVKFFENWSTGLGADII